MVASRSAQDRLLAFVACLAARSRPGVVSGLVLISLALGQTITGLLHPG